MKKLLFLALLIFFKTGYAQIYSQGDLTVEIQVMNFNHDSTQCMSFGDTYFIITVQNSFIGDTVKIKNGLLNYLISTEINDFGQSPWNIVIPCQGCPVGIPDYFPYQNLVSFSGDPMIFISGTDTISNAFSNQVFTITDRCSYESLSGRVYIDNDANCNYSMADATLLTNNDLTIHGNYNGSFWGFYQYLQYGGGNYEFNIQQSYLIDGYITYSNTMLPFAYPNSCTQAIYNFDVSSAYPLTNYDFALQCTSNIDVAAYVGASGPVRPGIPFMLYPHVSNLGCDTVSGTLQLILDNRVTYNPSLSSVPPTTISGDTLTWNYGPISNLSSNGFWNTLTAGLHLTPNTSVNIGDTLCFSVSTNIPSTDINTANNQYSVCYAVVNSYDPNVKEVMPKGVGATGIIPPNTSELTYTVHFQNTGNAPAINVYIIDTLDVNIIPESIEILGRSHTMTPEWVAQGVVKFNFNNINLADSFSNEPASHGFVTYKVKLNGPLNIGTVIENTANIYFDFNAPIVTNTAMNTIDILTSNNTVVVNENLSVYPNPANNELFIKSNNIKAGTLAYFEMYNIAGEIVLSQNINQNNMKVDLNGLSQGLYLLKTNVEGVVSTVKIIKE